MQNFWLCFPDASTWPAVTSDARHATTPDEASRSRGSRSFSRTSSKRTATAVPARYHATRATPRHVAPSRHESGSVWTSVWTSSPASFVLFATSDLECSSGSKRNQSKISRNQFPSGRTSFLILFPLKSSKFIFASWKLLPIVFSEDISVYARATFFRVNS